MSTTSTSTAAEADVAAVRAGYEAFAKGDLATLGTLFREDATWNHRNDDRFAGVHSGADGIIGFIGESAQLTAGTLRVTPLAFPDDGAGRVPVVVRMTGTRPDGRALDDLQIHLFELDDDDRVRAVDQFVGDPAKVTAFWA
jgi:hypothetical protein